jgi:hypothetical protein
LQRGPQTGKKQATKQKILKERQIQTLHKFHLTGNFFGAKPFLLKYDKIMPARDFGLELSRSRSHAKALRSPSDAVGGIALKQRESPIGECGGSSFRLRQGYGGTGQQRGAHPKKAFQLHGCGFRKVLPEA